MLRDGVKKRVLDNGLTVLVKENHVSPVVAIFTYVKAGYFNEPDSLVGISHLMEHMFFKGTSRRGVGEMAKETKSLGGYLNASTIYDHTLYYTVLPSRNFSQGLDIQSDALMHPVFKPEELKQETEVVIQEAKRKLDRPAAVAMERMFELAFDRHRMKRWRIGTEEGLRSLSREDFLSFHRDLYHPKNIILVVVGDVSAERALREIEKVYGDFEEGVLRKEESPAEPPQREFKYRQLRGDIQQGYLTVGFHTPEAFHPDSYAVEILAFVLGYGRSSRLYHNIKQQVNLVNTISASNYELNDLGIFMVEAIVEPQKVARAEKAIFQEIAKVRSEPVTEEELTKARNILESHYVSSMQSVSGQASMLAAYEALGDYHLAEQYLSNLYEVTYRDVLRVANRYLIMNNCSLLEYVPQGPDTEPVEKSQKRFELRHLLEKTSLELPELPTEPDYTEPFIYVRSKGVEGDIERHVFPNGLTLLVKESHQLPLVSAGFFCKGGQSDEGPENAGITGLTLRTSLKGTRNRTAAEIARQIESLGSSIHYSNDPDYLSYSINTLSKNFESGLEILTDVMTRPTFSTDELRKEKENTLNAILQEKDDMVRYPLKLFYSKLFKNHTYGLPASGEPEFIRCCTRQELQAWHLRLLNPRNLTAVVVGDVESGRAKELIEKAFGTLKSDQDLKADYSAIKKLAQIEESIETRDKAQTALVLGFLGPKYSNPEYYALTVLQNAVSGLGGLFFEELRGRRSLAYTVSAFLVSRLQGGAFVSYIATSPDKEHDAKEGVLRQFEKLIHQPISEKELSQAVQYTVGTYQIGLQTNRAKMLQYAHFEIMGKGLEEAEGYLQNIERVTAEDILNAAQKYFHLDRYALGMVRGNLLSISA